MCVLAVAVMYSDAHYVVYSLGRWWTGNWKLSRRKRQLQTIWFFTGLARYSNCCLLHCVVFVQLQCWISHIVLYESTVTAELQILLAALQITACVACCEILCWALCCLLCLNVQSDLFNAGHPKVLCSPEGKRATVLRWIKYFKAASLDPGIHGHLFALSAGAIVTPLIWSTWSACSVIYPKIFSSVTTADYEIYLTYHASLTCTRLATCS